MLVYSGDKWSCLSIGGRLSRGSKGETRRQTIEGGNVRFRFLGASCCQSLCGGVSWSPHSALTSSRPFMYRPPPFTSFSSSSAPWLWARLSPGLRFSCSRPPAMNTSLGHSQVFALCEGTYSDLFCFHWCLSSAKTWVRLVILSLVLTVEGSPFFAQELCPRKQILVDYEEDLARSQGCPKMRCSAWSSSNNFCHWRDSNILTWSFGGTSTCI